MRDDGGSTGGGVGTVMAVEGVMDDGGSGTVVVGKHNALVRYQLISDASMVPTLDGGQGVG